MKKLIDRILELRNPTVAGLDPTLANIPDCLKEASFRKYGKTLRGAAHACYRFNKALIDALCDVVPAVKPQCAYYEQLGWYGVKYLYKTILYAKEKGLYVITDGKRNDIGSTMNAYAAAHLGEIKIDDKTEIPFGAHALTVNGYLGTDGVTPVLDALGRSPDAGAFILVKTSNPSSGELQDLILEDGRTVYAAMGDMCEAWGNETLRYRGYSQVGAVVGATYPRQLGELRARLPHTLFLVPGYGAQGGGARDVAGAFDENGLGAVVNSSRAILAAWKKTGQPEKFAEAAREEALRMREDLQRVIPAFGGAEDKTVPR